LIIMCNRMVMGNIYLISSISLGRSVLGGMLWFVSMPDVRFHCCGRCCICRNLESRGAPLCWLSDELFVKRRFPLRHGEILAVNQFHNVASPTKLIPGAKKPVWEVGGWANLNTAQCGSDLSTTPDNLQVPSQARVKHRNGWH
jgi:hypothetical protein